MLCMKGFRVVTILLGVLPVSSIYAQSQNTGWDSVRRVTPGQAIRVKSSHHPIVCEFQQADDAGLSCVSRRAVFFFPVTKDIRFRREDIQSIRLSRQALSMLTGVAIGVGVGAGTGAAVDASAKDQKEEGHVLTVVLGLLGGLIGGGIGQNTDFLAGPVVYRAP